MGNISNTVFMLDIYSDSLKSRGIARSSVHHVLLERGLELLRKDSPEAAAIVQPMLRYMLHAVTKPDKKGDHEKGTGQHYYCSADLSGKAVSPVCGYYKNALGHFGKSARSMLEEDYTMALTMYRSGFIMQASGYLARAVHMLCDICCLPHAVAMTYFSPNGRLHHAYENAASYIYPDLIPLEYRDIPDYFSDRRSFSDALNGISEKVRSELPMLYTEYADEIFTRLYDTETMTAAFLKRFSQDTALSPEKAHCIANGTTLRSVSENGLTVTATVTQNGLLLASDGRILNHKYSGSGRYFAAAHRRNGLFTLSPARCEKDRVFVNGTYKHFDPRNKQAYFSLK